ncbi:MAG: hypothetical protein JXJ20_13885 [Anaerolineae bacterium]|nr:hypothetical protein [Anaerolineae bacterium]
MIRKIEVVVDISDKVSELHRKEQAQGHAPVPFARRLSNGFFDLIAQGLYNVNINLLCAIRRQWDSRGSPVVSVCEGLLKEQHCCYR